MFRRTFIAACLFAAALGSASAQAPKTATAIFAGGCFWCTEADFDKVPGVISTTSGYLNGKTKNPTYKEVSAGGSGHVEAVEVVYDPAKVTYAKLLDAFWRSIDPLVKDKQFCDTGDMYRTGIYYLDDEQKKLADESKTQVAAKFAPRTVYTEIVKADTFYKAEDYHQDYYKKNEGRYNFYRWNCGRDQRLEQLWGKKESS
ncbi:MAG: peptide-methionine (S)-S-oxide reductase [Hyphomicrobiales bacterium]|jgi:peptide-methionine (S)-S-oxide reductase|nr:peptide-methionine (S)-S-oxide reductase [Hyphomicrobiales bacterium]